MLAVLTDQHCRDVQVQRAATMSGDLTKPEDVVPFIVFLATDGAPPAVVCRRSTSLLSRFLVHGVYIASWCPKPHMKQPYARVAGRISSTTATSTVVSVLAPAHAAGWWITGQTILVNGGYCTSR